MDKTYIVCVDYKFSHKKKGLISKMKRSKLNREIRKIITELGNKPYDEREMYFTANGMLKQSFPADRRVFLYRDNIDLTNDIRFEILQLEGVQDVHAYEPVKMEDLT